MAHHVGTPISSYSSEANKEGTVELKSRIEDNIPGKNYTDMVEMFRTGKEPLAHESILKCIAVLEALERSASNEKWVEVKDLNSNPTKT